MSRGRLLALLGVLALLAGALVVGGRGGGAAPVAAPGPDLVALRADAALAPCPSGVSAALPDLELACVGAPGQVRLQDSGPGRPALVNVWATWCGPCVREVPLLEQAWRDLQGELDVVGVLTQDTVENGLRFAADPSLGFDMSYPSVLDEDGTVMRTYGSGPPITLFVDADGAVAHVQRGELTSQAQLDGLLAEHLGLRR